MSADPLPAAVRTLFGDLSHAGAPPADAAALTAVWQCGEAGRESLGTRVRFCLSRAGTRVLQARYRAYGCPYTLAVCEWLARGLQGAELAAALPAAAALAALVAGPTDWATALGVPDERLGRLLVVEDALHAALDGPVGVPDPAVTNRA